jgi:hypothetical protein
MTEAELKELRAQFMQLTAIVGQQRAEIDALRKEIAAQKTWIEKLAAKQKLEWSQDAGDWRSRELLEQIRKG